MEHRGAGGGLGSITSVALGWAQNRGGFRARLLPVCPGLLLGVPEECICTNLLAVCFSALSAALLEIEFS